MPTLGTAAWKERLANTPHVLGDDAAARRLDVALLVGGGCGRYEESNDGRRMVTPRWSAPASR